MRGVAARHDSKAERGFVEWESRRKIAHGKVHVVTLIAECFLELSLHNDLL